VTHGAEVTRVGAVSHGAEVAAFGKRGKELGAKIRGAEPPATWGSQFPFSLCSLSLSLFFTISLSVLSLPSTLSLGSPVPPLQLPLTGTRLLTVVVAATAVFADRRDCRLRSPAPPPPGPPARALGPGLSSCAPTLLIAGLVAALGGEAAPAPPPPGVRQKKEGEIFESWLSVEICGVELRVIPMVPSSLPRRRHVYRGCNLGAMAHGTETCYLGALSHGADREGPKPRILSQ
jgi:hypothetical protein